MKLMMNAMLKLFSGILLVGLLLFWPAGTFAYWNAWLFMALLFLPMLIVGIVLALKAPELLKKRLSSKEQEGTQKVVVTLSALLFLAIPLVLGPWPCFVMFLCGPVLLVLRIGNEEKVLEQGLAGYTEYKQKVRYRMIPFVW